MFYNFFKNKSKYRIVNYSKTFLGGLTLVWTWTLCLKYFFDKKIPTEFAKKGFYKEYKIMFEHVYIWMLNSSLSHFCTKIYETFRYLLTSLVLSTKCIFSKILASNFIKFSFLLFGFLQSLSWESCKWSFFNNLFSKRKIIQERIK